MSIINLRSITLVSDRLYKGNCQKMTNQKTIKSNKKSYTTIIIQGIMQVLEPSSDCKLIFLYNFTKLKKIIKFFELNNFPLNAVFLFLIISYLYYFPLRVFCGAAAISQPLQRKGQTNRSFQTNTELFLSSPVWLVVPLSY